jgi:hypothetical protein
MKNTIKIVFFLCFTITFISCSQNQSVKKSLKLSQQESDLKLDFNKGKFKISNGIPNLAKVLTDYIYNNDLKVSERVNQFNLRKSGSEILINYPDYSSDIFILRIPEPVNAPKTITCNSESAAKETLAKILGDGKQGVNIEYKRSARSVSITYDYLKGC